VLQELSYFNLPILKKDVGDLFTRGKCLLDLSLRSHEVRVIGSNFPTDATHAFSLTKDLGLLCVFPPYYSFEVLRFIRSVLQKMSSLITYTLRNTRGGGLLNGTKQDFLDSGMIPYWLFRRHHENHEHIT